MIAVIAYININVTSLFSHTGINQILYYQYRYRSPSFPLPHSILLSPSPSDHVNIPLRPTLLLCFILFKPTSHAPLASINNDSRSNKFNRYPSLTFYSNITQLVHFWIQSFPSTTSILTLFFPIHYAILFRIVIGFSQYW